MTYCIRAAGLAYASEVGFEEIIERGRRVAGELPEDLVYMGFSLGVLPAQTRSGARGAVLIYACVPVAAFGVWPAGLPVQVHGMADDPIFADEGDLAAARALVAANPRAELFLYAGNQHYFADSSLPSYDAAAATLLRQRVRDFLRAHS